jgi:tripeptide aminopeptidase
MNLLMQYQSFQVADRLMRYVSMDTQSDPHATTFPSTEKQKELARLLVQELRDMGIVDAEMDDNGYVYATIPSNQSIDIPVICFCSHIDTAPDCSGSGVKPILHRNYQGNPIILPDDPAQIITLEEHPYLREKMGEDIITASGTTLLGADDKAGVAIIMELAATLLQFPEIPHGTIRLLFTPDEEVGRGVDKLDMKRLGADFGYTLDGGERGALEGENFSADGAVIHFYGISAHPGDAKNKMVNALKVAAHFMGLLPVDQLAPEVTSGREGFVHPVSLQGIAEKASVHFILRDHHTPNLAVQTKKLREWAAAAVAAYPGAQYTIEITTQYRNMRSILEQHPAVLDHAREAMRRAGIQPRETPIRGGTDGSRLSFMGLPCPNIFTGEMALHGKHEYVSVQDMQASVTTLIHLVQVWAKQ